MLSRPLKPLWSKLRGAQDKKSPLRRGYELTRTYLLEGIIPRRMSVVTMHVGTWGVKKIRIASHRPLRTTGYSTPVAANC
jgi:hypothetical protein